ncbi:MAG: transketolase C-terminal domain-containing protein, partial [Eubacteriales bacterium]
MTSALEGTDPVVFFESQRIYDKGEEFLPEGVPEGYYEVKLGEPDVKRQGKDVTILTIGAVLYRALDAAKILEEKYGVSAEVIDARSIVPFDYSKVLESVKKTGRILIVGDACERNSVMKDMAANITEFAFDYLDAPPIALGSRNWITPAHELEQAFFPYPDEIIDAIHEKLLPLPGHVAKFNLTDLERMERSKNGI